MYIIYVYASFQTHPFLNKPMDLSFSLFIYIWETKIKHNYPHIIVGL